MFAPETQICCNNVIHAIQHQSYSLTCCDSSYVSADATCSSQGSTCSSVAFSSSQHFCCDGLLHSILDEKSCCEHPDGSFTVDAVCTTYCEAIAYDVTTQLCFNDVIYETYQGFYSLSICGQSLSTDPTCNGQDTCGDLLYDSTTTEHIYFCCNGQLHEKAAGQCCSHPDGAQTVELSACAVYCGDVEYDSASQLCCGDTVRIEPVPWNPDSPRLIDILIGKRAV